MFPSVAGGKVNIVNWSFLCWQSFQQHLLFADLGFLAFGSSSSTKRSENLFSWCLLKLIINSDYWIAKILKQIPLNNTWIVETSAPTIISRLLSVFIVPTASLHTTPSESFEFSPWHALNNIPILKINILFSSASSTIKYNTFLTISNILIFFVVGNVPGHHVVKHRKNHLLTRIRTCQA